MILFKAVCFYFFLIICKFKDYPVDFRIWKDQISNKALGNMTKFFWTWELGDCFLCWAENTLDNYAFYSNTTGLNHPPVNSGHSPDPRNATAAILNGVQSGNDHWQVIQQSAHQPRNKAAGHLHPIILQDSQATDLDAISDSFLSTSWPTGLHVLWVQSVNIFPRCPQSQFSPELLSFMHESSL